MEPLASIERVSKQYVLDHSSVTALDEVSLRMAGLLEVYAGIWQGEH